MKNDDFSVEFGRFIFPKREMMGKKINKMFQIMSYDSVRVRARVCIRMCMPEKLSKNNNALLSYFIG